MAKVKIKRGDNVIVTTGKNKGSKGDCLLYTSRCV